MMQTGEACTNEHGDANNDNNQPQQLDVGNRVLIHALVSASGMQLNFQAGYILKLPTGSDGRYAVKPFKEGLKPCLLKRMNLLSSERRRDRELFLGMQTLQRDLRLRVVRPALDKWLHEDLGLLLLIASFAAWPRRCLFQFGGFMGRVWDEHWQYANPSRPLSLRGMPAPRLDAATTDLGLGQVMFAGGCGDHPRRCRLPDGFFKSAEIYDSLTNEWTPIACMPTRRHGATACAVGSKAYVLGGMYVDEGDGPLEHRFCDVLDIETLTWSTMPPGCYLHVNHLSYTTSWERAAFFGAGAVDGRVVALLGPNCTIVYNPSQPCDGWRQVKNQDAVQVGRSSCSCSFHNELVVASGRPDAFSRAVAAFRFDEPATSKQWWHGTWRQLPSLNDARVGASMAVVHGWLYITGGVDEETSDFCNDAERLSAASSAWEKVPWFQMPRALHAHDMFALPFLD